jgi:EAL domain-containing protein (putative c-di-GMP-specific phosphodiesterase class I)
MHLNYQPIVDIRSRKVVKAEALCRFPDSPPGLDTPDGFIPYAEKNGLMKGLTSWLFSTAFEYWARLGPMAPELTLNLSVQNLAEVDLAERMLETARANGLKPTRLWVELGERLFDVHDAASHANLARMAQAGVRIAVDGLGPGLSPVTHLQLADVPVRELKLDRHVTSEIDTDAAQRAKVAGIGEIAKHLSLDLAAKGVERMSIIDQLARAGFVRIQGMAIAPPMDGDAFASYLQRSPAPAA